GFKANNYEIASVERADLLSDYRAAAKLHPIKRRQARGSAKTKNIIMIIGDGMGTAASWVITLLCQIGSE
ncbi:MAG: hypothetical protein ACXV8Q_14265, partial [Methylobacter sp.]